MEGAEGMGGTACGCSADGSKHGECDVNSGQCECRQNVATAGQTDTNGRADDRTCSACLANFYGFGKTDGCLPCECNQAGSNGTQCAADGQCPCKDSIDGRQCSKCKSSFYMFSANGCQLCNCSTSGSTSVDCDQTLGTCTCKSNVQPGGKCDQCKPGFYNLADYNSRGCQPCFCFDHGGTCTSANGFTQAEVSASNTEGWTSENDFIIAPSEFVGDHHSSYGQLLKFHLAKLGADIVLSSQVLVNIEGNGFKLLYYGVNSMNGSTDLDVEVRLFPEMWKIEANGNNPTPAEMYRVLAGMKKMTFRKSVSGKLVALSMVSMVTAQEGQTAPVTFVENCTCTSDRFVSGISCENCSTGYMRKDKSKLSPYDTCIACACTSRATECDESTGVCLNCRNGTTGQYCQDCSAHVVSPGCTLCEDKFWGMAGDGCRACDCNEIGSTNFICDKNDGQCQCASHVTGRTCDVCEDNYHSLKKDVGCIVCSQCYGLVGSEVTQLRLLRDNLTTTVTELQTNDNTSSLDPFQTRLAAANSAMGNLLNYLKTSEASEENIRGKLSSFNATIKHLSTLVDSLQTEDKPKITALLQEAQMNLQKATDAKNKLTTDVIEIDKLIAPLEVLSTSLGGLVVSLQNVEVYLQGISDSSSSGLQGILTTVSLIENTTSEANKLAEKSLQVVQSVLKQHDKNGRDIAALEGSDVSLTSLGVTARDEAKRVEAKMNSTLDKATTLQTTTQSLGASTTDFQNLNTQLNFLKSRADTAKSQATGGTADLQSKQQKILQASSLAEQQRMNTVNMVAEGDALEKRSVNADRKSADAKRSADAIFVSAENMLQTMVNFNTKAAEVETKAAEALKTVQAVNELSQQVITESNALITSLSSTQQKSSMAKETARQAKTVAQQQNNAIKNVGEESTILVSSLDKDFADINIKSGRPQEVTNSIVTPAKTLCQSYETGMTDVNGKITAASLATTNAKASVNAVSTNASKLLNELRNLGNVDTARIAQLQQEVAASQNLFDSQTLVAAINVLKQELNTQKQWLITAKQRKVNLGKEITRLKAVQELIIP